MQKQLFFDDNNLFVRENVKRSYGHPQHVATYHDGVCSTDWCAGWVFRLDDGRYRMLYFGESDAFQGKKLFCATSADGVHFEPEQLFADKTYAHEVMSIEGGSEVASICEDEHAIDPSARYKLLMSEYDGRGLSITDALYISPDLLHWTRVDGVAWGDGTEPMACVFYNKKQQCHTVVERSFWGIRHAGYKETRDWKCFTDYRECLNVDALDEPLSEVYGIPCVFDCGGTYIGLAHMYRGLHSEYNAKFFGGTIDTQLVYSYDGRYWKRSLREPFLTGTDDRNGTAGYPLVWTPCVREDVDGSLLFYATGSELEHGPAFRQHGTGRVFVYRLRRDGFISLATEDSARPSAVALRELAWHGGEVHINVKAKRATLAVRCSNESENVGGNVLGLSHPVEGYDHDDCIPFEGDSTDWVPSWKDGKTLTDLTGKTLVLEIRFEDGELYSVSGDFTLLFNTPAARFRKYGELPN